MYKLSINKELFENILLKRIIILEKENTNYWKKELLEPILKENKLTYEIKQFEKIIITNGLGKDKPQIVVECLTVYQSIQKNVFDLHIGKIAKKKTIIQVEDEKDILIKKLLKEKEELESKLKEKVKMVQQKIKFE